MPDWFYRTVSQPVLFALPERWAQGIALGVIGTLGRWSIGRAAIDVLGHLRAPDGIARTVAGISFPSPIGLGAVVDADARASQALARFGVGAMVFGPVTEAARTGCGPRRCRDGLQVPAQAAALGADAWQQRFDSMGTLGIPRVLRLEGTATAIDALVARFAPCADGFIMAGERCPVSERPVFRLVEAAGLPAPVGSGFAGVVLETSIPGADGGSVMPLAPSASLVQQVSVWRRTVGADQAVIVSGGVAEPEDALRLLRAGADLILIDAGLVFTGPGLPKRINEALAGRPSPGKPVELPRVRQGWWWGAVLGASMLVGGVMALVIACTGVLLPYDEQFLGMTAGELASRLPRLHDFMAHDRITLAGTMIGVGILYLGLARGGMRRGQHHAQVALTGSAVVGFVSFFWFLGFGYFDPFHAFVSTVLLQFLVLAMVLHAAPADDSDAVPDLHDDASWRQGLWAQLLLVVHSIGLIGAGVLISFIGMTRVFIAEDLAYLCLTRESLAAFNDKLIPLIAHDRASLGGMLLACGSGMLLPVLWGWRRGRAWLWWTLFATGLPAYAAAIGVHLVVGYTDWRHLLPAAIGLGLWVSALALGWNQLCAGRRTPVAKTVQEQ